MLAAILVGCSGAGEAEPASPTPESEGRFQTPAALESYRYTIDIRASTEILDTSEAPEGLGLEDAVVTVHIEGARVNPDREYSRSESSMAFLTTNRETIMIGDRLWSREEAGAWRQRATLTGPEDLIGHDTLMSPAVIFGTERPELLAEIAADMEGRPYTVETLGGRQVWHWSLDSSWIEKFRDDFQNLIPEFIRPEQLSVDIYTDIETGVGVRLDVSIATDGNPEAGRLVMDLFDLNNAGIVIEEPVGAIGP